MPEISLQPKVSNLYGLTLPRYAEIIGYSECAFFGIYSPSNENYACRNIWTKDQRDMIADYLVEAQDEIENVIGYPLSPRWIENEEHPYSSPVLLNYGKLIAIGTQAIKILQNGAIIDYSVEPAKIIIATDIISTEYVALFYPDTSVPIVPQSMNIEAGNLVIYIPKCRLLKLDKMNNPVEGWDGSDETIYQETVDIINFYTDETKQASIIYDPLQCTPECATMGEDICAYISNANIGAIRLGGRKDNSCLSTGIPRRVRVNYFAGLMTMTRKIEMAIIRLAHSRMPTEPCGCDITQRLWKRDRHEPVVLDRERLNCPFGTSDGAWASWRLAVSLESFRARSF